MRRVKCLTNIWQSHIGNREVDVADERTHDECDQDKARILGNTRDLNSRLSHKLWFLSRKEGTVTSQEGV